jgi:hypothetical protein
MINNHTLSFLSRLSTSDDKRYNMVVVVYESAPSTEGITTLPHNHNDHIKENKIHQNERVCEWGCA